MRRLGWVVLVAMLVMLPEWSWGQTATPTPTSTKTATPTPTMTPTAAAVVVLRSSESQAPVAGYMDRLETNAIKALESSGVEIKDRDGNLIASFEDDNNATIVGRATVGDESHLLTIYQSPSESRSDEQGTTPSVYYNSLENYIYPSATSLNRHATFTPPIYTPGTVIKSVTLVLWLTSGNEEFNVGLYSKPFAYPESTNVILDLAALNITDASCTSITNYLYSYNSEINYTVPEGSQVWLKVRLYADSYGPDCRLIGVKWVFEKIGI